MMTVGVDRAAVETALFGGELECPALGCPALGCWGRLAPWGWARGRIVRGEVGDVRLRPRRARCRQCRGTHVLLPVSVLLRRADEVTVIGAALLAKAGGCGHRRIAARLGLPASTVRGWLRRIGVVADLVLAVLGVLAAQLGGEFVAPAPTVGPVAAVVELVGALAGAVVRRLGGSCVPWRLAVVVCGGRLLSPHGPDLVRGPPVGGNTSWLWAAGR
ncbi:MAG: hypothetical protein ACRDRQ_20260 [Pseudonocardiaceae bacterium]